MSERTERGVSARGEPAEPSVESRAGRVREDVEALRTSNLLLHALAELQTEFIQGREPHLVFDKLLSVMLDITGSEYGFIGEVLRTPEGEPFLRTFAITNIAWTPELREYYAHQAPKGMEFRNMRTLFGEVITSGRTVVSNTPEQDTHRGGMPAGHPPLRSFLGLPFRSPTEMLGMMGIANRAGGYDEDIIRFLQPVLATGCAILQGLRSEQRQQRAEAELRRSAQSFHTLIERSPDAMFIHRSGTVLMSNPAALRMLGHQHDEELRGRSIDSLVRDGSTAMMLYDPFATATPQEVHFRHQEGKRVLAEVITVPLDFDGEPALAAIARDITERRQVQEKLQSTERMVSLGTLAAGVAHEINNPLSYMLSNLRFVDDELTAMAQSGEGVASERGQEAREALKEALSGTHRVRDIVRDLKTFSRVDDEQRGPVDVRGVLDSCVNMAWSEIRHRARLEKHYGVVPPVLGNESRLGQVFLNLLVNAAQAISHGDLKTNEIRLTTRLEHDQVVVEVRDTGSGIPPENLERLFDPFFTTKPAGVGTGLGLSICHGIITAMGGRITVQSQVGQGSCFQVFLPTSLPPAPAPAPAAS